MNEDCGAFGSAMLQKSQDAGIVEIFLSDVIADLYAEVAVAQTAGEFDAGCVDILQGNLAERFKPAFRALAHFKSNVIKQTSAIERVFGFARVGKKHRRG